MPTSDTGTAEHFLPGSNEQATTGRESAATLTGQPTTHPVTHAAPRKVPRRTKAPDDVDSDYAEEAEDFFYGEGR